MAEERITVAEWVLRKFSKKAKMEAREQKKPPELKVFNPLELKCGDLLPFEVAHTDLLGKMFTVTEVDLWERELGGEFVDYILQGENRDEVVTLRAFPKASTSGTGISGFDLLVLFRHRRFGYDEGGEELHKNILPSGLLTIHADDESEIGTYARLGDVKEPHRGKVTIFQKDVAPRVEYFEYWDFVREIEVRGKKEVDYYFVEMSLNDEDRGTFQTYHAIAISNYDVKPLHRSIK